MIIKVWNRDIQTLWEMDNKPYKLYELLESFHA